MLCWSFCLAFMLLTAPSVTTKSKLCHQIALYTLYYRSELNCQKRASVTICSPQFWAFLNPPTGWGMELVRNSAIYHSMGPLSLHGLSFSLCSEKRAEAGRPMRGEEENSRPIRSLDSLNSPPIVWPSVRGASRREQGGTLPCKTSWLRFGMPLDTHSFYPMLAILLAT